MAATEAAAAAAVTVGVSSKHVFSVRLYFCQPILGGVFADLSWFTGRSGPNDANALPIGNRRW
jgi:hypothetical protein